LENYKSKITALFWHKNAILVGTSDGVLYISIFNE